MTPTVAAVLADDGLMAHVDAVVPLRVPLQVLPSASCATEGCERPHPIGARFCAPCRADRDKARRRRWWEANRARSVVAA